MLQDGLQVNQGSVGFFSRMVNIVCKDLSSAFQTYSGQREIWRKDTLKLFYGQTPTWVTLVKFKSGSDARCKKIVFSDHYPLSKDGRCVMHDHMYRSMYALNMHVMWRVCVEGREWEGQLLKKKFKLLCKLETWTGSFVWHRMNADFLAVSLKVLGSNAPVSLWSFCMKCACFRCVCMGILW